MTDYDREKLNAFLKRGEGGAPPVLVGRKDVLNDLERAGRDNAGEGKNTRILQGAPGAGKSSILAEMLKRSLPGGPWAERGPRIVVLQASQLNEDMQAVMETVEEALDPNPSRWMARSKEALRWLTLRGMFGPLELSVTPRRADRPQTFSDLARLHPHRYDGHPILVAVDEAQSLVSGDDTPQATFLQAIHGARTNQAIGLVLAGLGDTRDKAIKMQLTRPAATHTIGAIADGTDLLERTCASFGLVTEGVEGQLGQLAGPCKGWPRHLHIAMRALGSEAVKADGDLARVDWARIGRWSHWGRVDYYDAQTSREISDAIHVVAAVVDGIDPFTPASSSRVQEIILTTAGDREGHRLPPGCDANGFRDILLHRGVLDERADGTYQCAIPSFAGHLTRLARSPGPPPDDAILQARADRSVWQEAVAVHERVLKDRDVEIMAVREDHVQARNEFRAAGPLAFFRKRRLDKARREAAAVLDRLEAARMQLAPPIDPPATLLNAATLPTVAEQEAEQARSTCTRLVEAGLLEIATQPPPGREPPRIVITDPAHRPGSSEAAAGGVDWSLADAADRQSTTLLLWDGTDSSPVQALARLPPAQPLVPATDAVRASLAMVEGVAVAKQETVEDALQQTHHRERIKWVEACRIPITREPLAWCTQHSPDAPITTAAEDLIATRPDIVFTGGVEALRAHNTEQAAQVTPTDSSPSPGI